MKKQVLTNDLLLLLTSLIWGSAFVAQRVGMDYIGPFTFNGVRFLIGPLSLIPLIAARWKKIPPEHKKIKPYVINGVIAGSVVFTASTLQQVGIVYTTAGNAGFITGFYVVLVPILGYFLGQSIGLVRWMAALLALAGLYFLSVTQELTMGKGDMLVLGSALFWPSTLSLWAMLPPAGFADILVCPVFSLRPVKPGRRFYFRNTRLGRHWQRPHSPSLRGHILRRHCLYPAGHRPEERSPSHAVIILSMEGAFAALAGALILSEVLTFRQITGCVLMLSGMILSQLGRKK